MKFLGQQFQDNTTKNGFPSHLVDPKVKQSKEYCIAFAKAMDGFNGYGTDHLIFKNNIDTYREWRKLMRGKQDPDQYKPQIGIKKGKNQRSWRAIDFSIFPIATKFKEIAISKIINQSFTMSIKGIDRKSVEEKKQFRNKQQERLINKDFIVKQQQLGVNYEDANSNIPVPEDMESIDVHTDMYFNDEFALEARDALKDIGEKNNRKQIEYDVSENLVEVGIAGIRTWVDSNGDIRERSIVPELCKTNYVTKKDFSDLSWFGEYITMSIAELKVAWPGQSEKTYRKIAVEATGKRDYERLPYDDEAIRYPYDNEKITIFDAIFKSDDMWVHMINKENGYTTLSRRPYNWPSKHDTGERISDEDYQGRYPDRQIIRTPIENWYQCKWIVGTKEAFDFGLMKNIPRISSNIAKTIAPVTIYTTNFDSIARLIEPIIHNIQINWLQYQNHVARSRPSGLEIEMSALENISLGKSKQRLHPKEVLRMYMDTGILLWRRKDWNGASNQWRPIQELRNGIGDDAMQHLNLIISEIDFLRQIIGINEIEDASTPNPKTLVRVAQMASIGTSNALNYLFFAFRSIRERSAKCAITYLPDAREIAKQKGFEYGLGQKSDEFWRELSMRELAVIIEEYPDAERREKLAGYVQASIESGELSVEDAFEIEDEDNLHRAVQIFRQRRKQRMKENQESQQQGYQMEQEKNLASAKAAQEGEISKINAEYDRKDKSSEMQAFFDVQMDKEKTKNQIIILKLQQGLDLTVEEERRVTELMKEDRKGEWDLRVAKVRGSQSQQRKLIDK